MVHYGLAFCRFTFAPAVSVGLSVFHFRHALKIASGLSRMSAPLVRQVSHGFGRMDRSSPTAAGPPPALGSVVPDSEAGTGKHGLRETHAPTTGGGSTGSGTMSSAALAAVCAAVAASFAAVARWATMAT